MGGAPPRRPAYREPDLAVDVRLPARGQLRQLVDRLARALRGGGLVVLATGPRATAMQRAASQARARSGADRMREVSQRAPRKRGRPDQDSNLGPTP